MQSFYLRLTLGYFESKYFNEQIRGVQLLLGPSSGVRAGFYGKRKN